MPSIGSSYRALVFRDSDNSLPRDSQPRICDFRGASPRFSPLGFTIGAVFPSLRRRVGTSLHRTLSKKLVSHGNQNADQQRPAVSVFLGRSRPYKVETGFWAAPDSRLVAFEIAVTPRRMGPQGEWAPKRRIKRGSNPPERGPQFPAAGPNDLQQFGDHLLRLNSRQSLV